ncbi:MAG: glycerophosphodiester phosphodiesterase [Erysipelotrichia bacterium]|nr:glycerophosphodiester phosphodiesterase [Erysipelotrichia bacterium]NCC54442.1 glycerophosphodiester phosphodiesterase [Erysipelotrichia bacterium]
MISLKTHLYWICGSILLVGCYLLIQFFPCTHLDKGIDNPIPVVKKPLVIAHRGAKKLYPENTVYAFEKSVALGVDAIEVDVRLSSDDVLCSVHDEDISHYTNHKGKVEDYTYDQLSLFNFAYYFQNEKGEYPFRNDEMHQFIPARIEDLFIRYQSDIRYVLEIKEAGKRGKRCATLLYDLILRYDLSDFVYVASFHQEVMAYFHQINQMQIKEVMDYKQSKDFVVASYLGYDCFIAHKANGLMLPLEERNIALDDRYLLYKIHKHHLFVFYWTIDDEKKMKHLLALGVDGMISDRPDLLLKVLNRQQDKLNGN